MTLRTLTNQLENEQFVHRLQEAQQSSELRNQFIQHYFPFVIKVVSEFTGSYVQVGDSDELSIALLGFNEAIDRYASEKGAFIPYAKLVMTSRLINYKNRMPVDDAVSSLDMIQDLTMMDQEEDRTEMAEAISIWKKELLLFGITFQKLIDERPKHRDTRERAYRIGVEVSKDEAVTNKLYSKFRLPLQLIADRFSVSVKIVDGSKSFITSVVIIFFKELGVLKRWIKLN